MHKMEALIENFYSEFFICATLVLNVLLKRKRKRRWKKKWISQIKLGFFFLQRKCIKLEIRMALVCQRNIKHYVMYFNFYIV